MGIPAKTRNLQHRAELLDSIKKNTNNLFGYYRGFVVETRDPKFMGRVRVRIPLIHGMDAQVESLPWAEVMSWGGGTSECGSYIQPLIGARVLVIFEQGHPQLPLVISTFRANPTKPQNIVMPNSAEVVTSPVRNETPTEVEGGDDTKQIFFKTWKGHTLSCEEKDGTENIRIIDRAGNVIEFSCPMEESGDKRRFVKSALNNDGFDPSEMSGDTYIRIKDISGQEIKLKVDPSNPEIQISTTGTIRLGGPSAQHTIALAQLLYNTLLRFNVSTRGHRHIDGDGKTTSAPTPPILPVDPVSSWQASGVKSQIKNTGSAES